MVSGYEPDGTPKGAAIRSFLLSDSNDGGMVVGFTVWGFDRLPRDGREGDLILHLDPKRIHPSLVGEDLNAVVVEGYYLPKRLLPGEPYSKDVVNYHSPIAGHPTLHMIHSSEASPGVLGFSATLGRSGNGAEVGFFLTGAPGEIHGDYCDGLTVMYPNDKVSPLDVDLNWKA